MVGYASSVEFLPIPNLDRRKTPGNLPGDFVFRAVFAIFSLDESMGLSINDNFVN